jgi:hypothetical protein
MLATDLPKEQIARHAGLNIKTINNMYNTTRREIVIQAAAEHYETLLSRTNYRKRTRSS